MIQSLEEKLKQASYQPSPEELSKQASTAAQIDNETLREQVAHLQQRISHLEDQLEDAQVLIEREEEAAKTRVARYKEKEAQKHQELEELRLLATNAAKSEAAARTRVVELEEAFRENTTALEDARAEIESLRTDLTVSSACTQEYLTQTPFRTSKILQNYRLKNVRQHELVRQLPQKLNISRHYWMLRNWRHAQRQISW